MFTQRTTRQSAFRIALSKEKKLKIKLKIKTEQRNEWLEVLVRQCDLEWAGPVLEAAFPSDLQYVETMVTLFLIC